jgi:hypothetical protein
VPLAEKRLSSKPNLHRRLKYVHAERRGKKSSRSATSLGVSHSSAENANNESVFSFNLLQRFILNSAKQFSKPYQKLVDEAEKQARVVPRRPTHRFVFCFMQLQNYRI